VEFPESPPGVGLRNRHLSTSKDLDFAGSIFNFTDNRDT